MMDARTSSQDGDGVTERPRINHTWDESHKETMTELCPQVTAGRKSPKSSKNGSARKAATKLSSQDTPAKGRRYKADWLVVSQRLRLAVTIVPKVMCTSIREALNAVDCGGGETGRAAVSTDGNERCAEVRRNQALESEDLGKMTRVAFVRDPFERALSAYHNSDTNQFIHINHCHNKTVCTFEEWVTELGKNSASSFKNEHFLPQVKILQFPQMRYDYVFRLSSPTDQHVFWTTLCERNHSIKANVAYTTNDTDSVTMYKGLEHFTPTVFNILSKLYAKDLILWRKVLKYGTPRDANNERTLYDFYISCKSRLKAR